MATSAHAVLGVAADAPPEQIRAAYRRRARELHPDRHVQPDGSIPSEAHEAFCALNRALQGALAASRLPRQAPVTVSPPRRGVVPQQRPRPTEAVSADPVRTLLTVPSRTSQEWSTEQLECWALVVVPAARAALVEATRTAAGAGALGPASATATAHALLTLTLRSQGRAVKVLEDRVTAAYDALESALPASVVDALPARAGGPVPGPGNRSLAGSVAGLVAAGIAGAGALQPELLTALLG